MKIVVLKYGGHALEDQVLNHRFCQDLAELEEAGMRFVIVHGGGPQINGMLDALKITSSFADGLRVTDQETLEVVEMVLCGQVNKYITRLLAKHGLNSCGISGEDGRLFMASQKNPVLGRVGQITRVNPALPLSLLKNGYTPVVAPLGLDEKGEPLNINADTAAGALAGSLSASFVLVSDVPGVLDAENKLLRILSEKDARRLVAAGVIHGGMLPKTEACLNALEQGCSSALILDGRQAGSLKRHLLDNEVLGTCFELD